MDQITLNYADYEDDLKAQLSGKQPGETCVLTIRAKINSNSDEAVTLDVEEVTLEDYQEPETAEEDTEEEVDEESAPAMVVAIAKKKSKP